VLGGVVHSSNAINAPGVVTHYAANKWIIGEPGGGTSPRAEEASDVFQKSGLNAPISPDIRRDMWEKLTLNIAANPLAALTRLPLGRWVEAPGVAELGIAMITETLEVAKAMGWDLTETIDPAKAVPTRPNKSGGRPSMLQDVEAGRPMEVEAIVGQVQAFAREYEVATPAIDVVLPILRGLDVAVSRPA
jgi:2-dehydropantoate 2-reductase